MEPISVISLSGSTTKGQRECVTIALVFLSRHSQPVREGMAGIGIVKNENQEETDLDGE